jgi:uncharacterized protein (TIGR02001 family)
MKFAGKVLGVAMFALAAGAFGAPSFAQTTAPAAAPTPAYTITGNVALTTDYTFRGLSQTNDNPAIQGGFDFAMANGFYLGTWASNIDFGFPGQSIELDLYGGYKFTAGPVGLDVGVIGYLYPGIKDCGITCGTGEADYYEGYVKASYSPTKPLALGLSGFYSPEFTGKTGNAYYIEANGAYTINDMFALSGAVGYQNIDDVTGVFPGKVSDDYVTWNVGGTLTWDGLAFDLRYVGTNVDAKDAIAVNAFTSAEKADDRIVFTIKKTL